MTDTTTAPAVVDDIEVESSQPVAVSATASPVQSLQADPGDEDPQESAPVDDASEAGKKLQSKRGSLQARIDAITKEKYDTQRERDEARQELQSLRAELAARTSRTPETPSKPAAEGYYTRPEPTEDEVGTKYDSYGDFVKDHGRWVREEIRAEQADASQRQQMAQRHESHASRFVEKIAEAEAVDPAFWSKISPDVANLRPSSAIDPRELQAASEAARQGHPGAREFLAKTAVADMVFDSDVSTELMAHLSANPSEFQRLSTLPPNVLFREMGRLEARFNRPAAASAGPARVTPPVSQAAPPIKPVGSTASAPERDPLADDLDVDEHIRVMNARERKSARR